MDKLKGILFAALSAATFGLIPLYANQAILDGFIRYLFIVSRNQYAVKSWRIAGGDDCRGGGIWNYGLFPDVVIPLYAHGGRDSDSFLLSRGSGIAYGYFL